MAKPPTPTPERAALAAAHQELIEAQATIAAAEDDHRLALRDFDGATGSVDDIKARIRELHGRRTYGLPNILSEINDELRICFSQQDTAERGVAPFAIAEQEARQRLAEAQFPAAGAQDRVVRAAVAVARAEADPVARECLARVREALDILATYGPDLQALADKDLLAPDLAAAVGSAAGGLLRRCTTGWPEFESRYRTSPWRTAKERLQQDPTAPLPQAPTP